MPRVRVGTWNIQFGLHIDDIVAAVGGHTDFAEIDLLCLQEASEHGGRTDASMIARALGADFDAYQVAAQTVKGWVQANAIVWNRRRLQVRRQDCVTLQPGKAAPTRWPDPWPRGLSRQARNSVVVEGKLDGLSVVAYSVHLDIFGASHKVEQMVRVFDDWHAQNPADMTIVAGDLNTFHFGRWPAWRGLRRLADAEGFEEVTRSIQWTQSVPRMRLKQKLDAILVHSSRVVDHFSWTLPLPGSDHVPILTALDISSS